MKKASTPYFGVPQFEQGTWGIVGCKMSAYRWHIQDPIVFNSGIKVTIEHFGWISPDENPDYLSNSWNEREDDYSSVAYWYQIGESTFAARAPHASERALANLDTIIRPHESMDTLTHGAGTVARQELDFLYADGHLFYRPPEAKDAWIEFPFHVKEKEPLCLLIKATYAHDYGAYQAYLDGVKLGGPMDLFSENIETHEHHLLDFWPEAGQHTFRLECVGKNPMSRGYYLGIESLRLRERRPRVMEYAHDKDKDWRADPQLYR